MSFLKVVQAIMEISTKEDFIKLKAKLVDKTIFIFNKYNLKEINMDPLFEVLLAIMITYLLDTTTRLTQKCQKLHPIIM